MRDAPVLTGLDVVERAGASLQGGVYYSVSALLDAGDPDDPGTETLASDPLSAVLLREDQAVRVRWACRAHAAGYRVYRHAQGYDEQLVAEVTASAPCSRDESWIDATENDTTTRPVQRSVAPGTLSAWKPAGALPSALADATPLLVGDDLYLVGGRAGVDSAAVLHAQFAPGSADLGAFDVAGALATARSGAAVLLVSPATTNVNVPYLLVLGGTAGDLDVPRDRSVEVAPLAPGALAFSVAALSSPPPFGAHGAAFLNDGVLSFGALTTQAFVGGTNSWTAPLCGREGCRIGKAGDFALGPFVQTFGTLAPSAPTVPSSLVRGARLYALDGRQVAAQPIAPGGQ
jgi:hypothetical protein